MNEREAMAILVAALPDAYMRREMAMTAAGSAQDVLADPHAVLHALGERGVYAVREALGRREEILEQIDAMGAHLLLRGEAGYPERLAQIPRPPHLLYVLGERDLRAELPIAIVGTRRPNDYGIRHTTQIAQALAGVGACIVSGLAVGVDAAAHEGALAAGGRTIAVLGGGLDRFFPEKNAALRDRILANGGSVVTEYPMGTEAAGERFLLRNRIVAGLCTGVLVTQGMARSGAQRTASDAADYGREVFALPGSVDDPRSQTPHRLISEGAHLAACAADILAVLAPGIKIQHAPARKGREAEERKTREGAQRSAHERREQAETAPKIIPQNLGEDERRVLTALCGGEMEFDALCEKTGMDEAALGAALISLEMDGHIQALSGLRYARSE